MRTLSAGCLAAILAIPVSVVPALALNPKSFVSSTGNNANSCATEAAPCRTFAGALAKTDPGGSIYCLDHGEFSGGVQTNITKSITIDCAGTGASINVVGSHGISVSATATDRINIRGLKVISQFNPILINGTGAAATIRVEECNIMSTTAAAAMGLGSGPSGVLELFISNTTISNSLSGLTLLVTSGALKATLDRVRIFNNTYYGIYAFGSNATTAPGFRVVVKNSTISGNGSTGIYVTSSGGTARVFVKDSVLHQNGTNGVQVDGTSAAVVVSGSAITQNDTGLSATNGGVLSSYGNNEIDGNFTSNGAFTTTLTLH